MGYVCQLVQVFAKEGEGWSSTGTTISDAFNVGVAKGMGKIKNSFSFSVPRGFDYFAISPNPLIVENLVKIWIWRDSVSYTDADLQMMGTIKDVSQSIDDSGDVLNISGDDFSEMFFDTQIPLRAENKSWVDIIQFDILGFLNESGIKSIEWYSAGNPTTKNNIDSFPLKTLIINYTKISELIDKLTSDEFTGDGKYVWWVEPQSPTSNKYWFKTAFKATSVAGTVTQGTDIFDVKVSKDKEDVKNFVIYNCGSDLYGDIVEGFKFDPISYGALGWKQYYCTEETQNIFTTFWNNEREFARKNYGTATFLNNDSGIPTADFPQSYDYTFSDGNVVSNDTEFNDYLREISLAAGLKIATNILTNSAKPKYNIAFANRFTNAYNAGESWQLNFPSRSLNRPLRIADIKYSVNEVSFTFEEDEANANID